VEPNGDVVGLGFVVVVVVVVWTLFVVVGVAETKLMIVGLDGVGLVLEGNLLL